MLQVYRFPKIKEPPRSSKIGYFPPCCLVISSQQKKKLYIDSKSFKFGFLTKYLGLDPRIGVWLHLPSIPLCRYGGLIDSACNVSLWIVCKYCNDHSGNYLVRMMESPHGVLGPEQSNLMYVSRGGWNFQWMTGKDGQLPTWIGALPEFQLSTFIFKKTFVDAQALFVAQAPFERHARIHGGGFKKVSLVISLQCLVYIVWLLFFVILNITCFMVLSCRLLFSSSRLH